MSSTRNGARYFANASSSADDIRLRPAEPQQRVAAVVADAVLHRGAVVEPGVRQPHARPGRRRVLDEIVRRPLALLRPDQRRAEIMIAELRADHLVRLALLDVGDARPARRGSPRLPACRRGCWAATSSATCAGRASHSARPARCDRRPGGARSRSEASSFGPPQPCSVAASFQDRSMASPTPVFMPSPPVGMTRCAASPAMNTRPSP